MDDADGGKGGAILLGGGSLTMTGCAVINNTSSADYRVSGIYTEGGGIYATAGSRLIITGSSISNNESSAHYSGWGGGIAGENATMTIRDSQLSGNIGYYEGGAISWSGGSLTIENCAITNNSEYPHTGEGYGGALLIHNTDVLVARSTIADNYANYGGAIFSSSSQITITESTIANNAALGGAVLEDWGDSALIIRNSTITGNVGYYAIGTFDLYLANSIVAGNSNRGPDINGTITSLRRRLFEGVLALSTASCCCRATRRLLAVGL